MALFTFLFVQVPRKKKGVCVRERERKRGPSQHLCSHSFSANSPPAGLGSLDGKRASASWRLWRRFARRPARRLRSTYPPSSGRGPQGPSSASPSLPGSYCRPRRRNAPLFKLEANLGTCLKHGQV